MSRKFTISTSKSVLMPNKCAICGSHPHTEYKISGASPSGFSFRVIYSTIKYQKAGIKIPVCLRHYFLILFVRAMMFISCTAMIFLGIAALVSLLDSKTVSNISWEYFAAFILSVVVFIISTRWQPIKLKDIG
jgi:hypothetical protein